MKSQDGGIDLLNRSEAMLRDERSRVGVSGNEFSYGGSRGRIRALDVLDDAGHSRSWFASGECIQVRMMVEALENLADPIFALTIKSQSGVEVYGTNTLFSKQPSRPMGATECREIVFDFALNLMPGHYFLSFGFTQFLDEELLVIHRRYDAIEVEVHAIDRTFGIANLHAQISERLIERNSLPA
jgi:teichoic acid transport system ATP-binding protein